MKNAFAITALAAVLTLSACNNASQDPASDRPLSASDDGQLAAGATATSGEAMDQTPPADAATATSMPGAGAVSVTDEERASLGVLNAINAHEIAAGNQALGKGVSGKVADYARKMVAEHTSNREMTNKMNPLETAPLAAEQVKKGEMQLQELAALEGDAYQKAYAAAMVKDHTEALATLDGMIPSASTPEVATHLRDTRTAVAMHLEEAKSLQDSK